MLNLVKARIEVEVLSLIRDEAENFLLEVWKFRALHNRNKRMMIILMVHKWNSDIFCFTKTKLKHYNSSIIKQNEGNRWMNLFEIEAQGNSGVSSLCGIKGDETVMTTS